MTLLVKFRYFTEEFSQDNFDSLVLNFHRNIFEILKTNVIRIECTFQRFYQLEIVVLWISLNFLRWVRWESWCEQTIDDHFECRVRIMWFIVLQVFWNWYLFSYKLLTELRCFLLEIVDWCVTSLDLLESICLDRIFWRERRS